MAYSPLKNTLADHSPTSDRSLVLVTPPPVRLANIVSVSTKEPSNHTTYDAADNEETDHMEQHETLDSKLSNFLSSLTSSNRQSYDMVEDDDYELAEQTTPTLGRNRSLKDTVMAEPPAAPVPPEDLPVRTASISQHLPLNHPMPDLQSLQGAYVKNVVRLEESAAQLSTNATLEDELRRLKQAQKQKERTFSGISAPSSFKSGPRRQISIKSAVSSIAEHETMAYTNDYIPTSFALSPTGSLKSHHSAHNTPRKRLSKSSQLSQSQLEPELQSQSFNLDAQHAEPHEIVDLDPRPIRSPSLPDDMHDDRPTTSGSGDTYQQARTLFRDFDGVHYAPDRHVRQSRRISLTRPPRARDSRAFKEPQPGEQMIYYPAPVPVMLNLPMRLSRANWGEHDKRRLQALSDIPDEMRKSAAWLVSEDGVPAPDSRHSKLPPQLRASAFFDQGRTTQNVQLKDGSAVATLDSILDAAATAPVSAFTDHPIAGHLGDDFFAAEKSSRKSVQMSTEKKAKRKSSLSNLLRPKRSSGNLSEIVTKTERISSIMLSNRDGDISDEIETEDDVERSIAPDPDEIVEHDSDNKSEHSVSSLDSAEHSAQLPPGFSAAPTTLLAELQMRKAHQRLRNRTAADAFPNGMHSTLLELDTVTQLQLKARKQKHVKLAWEDNDAVDKENFGDEDVPLGVLFPEKEQQNNGYQNRPLGLLEKKEIEDNEPLSHRRARLRGEPIQIVDPLPSPGISQQGEATKKPLLDLPSLGEPDQEDENDQEGETLAQRKLRMQTRKIHGASTDFAREMSSELGLQVDTASTMQPTSKTPDGEETLGQRKRRLQAEAAAAAATEAQSGRPTLASKRSLADVLRANPVGYVNPSETKTAHLAIQSLERAREREAKYLAAQEADRYKTMNAHNTFGQGHQAGLIQSTLYGQHGYRHAQGAGAGAANIMPNNSSLPMLPQTYPAATMQPGYPSMGMGLNSSTPNFHLTQSHQYPMAQGFGYHSMMDLTGMGPPLDQKQRARIEGWRQGIM